MLSSNKKVASLSQILSVATTKARDGTPRLGVVRAGIKISQDLITMIRSGDVSNIKLSNKINECERGGR